MLASVPTEADVIIAPINVGFRGGHAALALQCSL
jgi:hypothetical protein